MREATSAQELEDIPFPELAAALRARSATMLNVWLGEIRNTIPALSKSSDDELRDNMPNIIAGMADYLEAANGARKLVEESPKQGLTRFKQNYDMRSLMHEDRIFRRVAIRQVEAQLQRRMSQGEQIALDAGIDVMLQQAVVAFVDHQNERLRSSAESELKYLSFLSHDLNNNLSSVTLFLQVLRHRLADVPSFAAEVRTLDQAQEAILATIGGMGRLVQSERLRKSKVAVNDVPVNLHHLAANLVQTALRQAQLKELSITLDVPENAVAVSDAELITLVLQNLLSNAVKYSIKGEVRIHAERASGTEGGWTVAVIDQGPGIAREHLDRIFDAFNRGELHGQSGVGLGLAIASQAAKLLGSQIKVESVVGKGSTFSFTLPDKRPAAGHA